jgi:hypothetical protein
MTMLIANAATTKQNILWRLIARHQVTAFMASGRQVVPRIGLRQSVARQLTLQARGETLLTTTADFKARGRIIDSGQGAAGLLDPAPDDHHWAQIAPPLARPRGRIARRAAVAR